MNFDQSKKIIFVPFAYVENKRSGINISAETESKKIDVYMKNICNALVSAKNHNPTCTVALVTNLVDSQIPIHIRQIFQEQSVDVLRVNFDRFLFRADYPWSLAFYKFCALSHLLDMDYQYFCWLDSDVWVQGAFDAIWKEVQYSLMLYDINHGLNTRNYVVLCDEVERFTGKQEYITHFGGEFFAANASNARTFHERAIAIYEKMIQGDFVTTKGDEFITSLVAAQMRGIVKNSAAYICRYWTGPFRLVSTSYQYNKVLVLHVPDEKEQGMLRIFNHYLSKGRIPSDNKVWLILGLSRPHYIKLFKAKIVNVLRRK